MTTSSASVIVSKSDKRLYKHLTLTNGIQCLLIQDDEADKSAASLNVNVGCSLDPKPFFGTAHFLEHMLFMGSEKFPSENEYMEYVKDHGGYTNAFTSLTDTNYHFEVSNEGFEGAVDRFAQFFLCPLLGEDQTDREMNAVDSEFNMSLQSDPWRQFMLIQTLSHGESSLHRFNCGNLESLKQDGVREVLLNFHKTWYSSNIMKLAMCGKHSLEQMEKWATEYFSGIQNKNVKLPDLGLPKAPFTAENMGVISKYKPVMDKDQLTMYWILPYCEREYKSQPLGYFSHLFGHEGENSILSYLMKEGWAMGLSCGADHELSVFSDFCVTIDLTEKGLENYEKVAEAVFKYAQNIAAAGPQEFVFNETSTLGKIKFDFSDKGSAVNYCVSLARTMPRFESPKDVPHLLRHRYVADVFDTERTKQMAALLADPANSMMFLTSKKLDDATLPLKEKWYNIQYSSEKYSEAFMNRLKNPQPTDNGKKLDLPPPNTLLPTNFDIINDEAQFSQKPVLIEVQDGAEVWYKQDQQFKRPKGIVNLTIYHNDDGNVTATPAKQLFHHVWRACLSEFMREFKYMADCAGLDCSINSSNPAVNITWSGYNSSLPSYTEETAKMLHKFETAQISDIFALKKEELLMKYNNHYLQQTFRLAWGEVSSKVVPTEFECKQMTELLKNYSYDDFCAHRANFLKRGRQVWGFFGNITKDDALASFKSVQQYLNLKPMNRDELIDQRVVLLPANTEHRLDFDVVDKTNENSAFVSYFQHGLVDAQDFKTIVMLKLTHQFLEEATFNQLRTIEQLGYVVFTRVSNFKDARGIQMLVQSPQKGCSYIRNSMDKHLETMRTKAQSIPDDEFATMVKAVLVNIEEKDKNLAEENARFFSIEIETHAYVFDRQQRMAEAARAVTKADWQAFYEALMHGSRRRLDLHYNSAAHQDQESKTEFTFAGVKKWESANKFQQAMELSKDSLKTRYCAQEFKI